MKGFAVLLRLAAVTTAAAFGFNGVAAAIPAALPLSHASPARFGIDNYNEISALAAQEATISQAADPTQTAAAYAAALQQAQALDAATGANAKPWQSLGQTPLHADSYPAVSALGWKGISGRITSFAYDPRSASRWFLTSSDGGVWETTSAGDLGWHSIGDNLPTQIMGGIGFSTAKKGTIIVGTGDPSFCRYCIPGVGVYSTTNDGRTWTRARGVPDGALTFRVVVDPSNPNVIYAGTSKGLYRSTDDAVSFSNVHLPTTANCAKDANLNTEECFFANMVTDVVVRTPDAGGAGAGKVLAVVGWRASQAKNLDKAGTVQSPSNGLYESNSGAPGTFTYLSAPGASLAVGFPLPQQIGRTALGIAHGAGQNHDVVYALVQDALKLTTCETLPASAPVIGTNLCASTVTGSVFDGLYSSPDFGAHWAKMTDALLLHLPGSNSSLAPFGQLGYNPGVQSWYNLWVEPDPTATDAASKAPTRLAFGLEEVWENDAAGTLPALGPTGFHVIARYWNACPIYVIALTSQCDPYLPSNSSFGVSTTHPDQHAGMFVPQGGGKVALVIGNDGGVYKQIAGSPSPLGTGSDFDNDHWGDGINNGLNTLQPYDAQISADGTVVAGLQDNGEMKITPVGDNPANGSVDMINGGDGFFTGIDPHNSNNIVEEYTYGAASVSADGGSSWSTRGAAIPGAQFITPLQVDPRNPSSIMIGGRAIETTTGYSSVNWTSVYNLGTQSQPGVAAATAGAGDTDNQTSALDYLGGTAYVGYCGHCDPLSQGGPFKTGIATNQGGSWHIAAVRGLPNRYITSVRMDPANTRTVYVTLAGYSRRWVPPGAVGDGTDGIGTGHIFVSRDGGNSFTDLSGKPGQGGLPDAPAEFSVLHGKQLLVATDVGVFVGTLNGNRAPVFTALGRGLPHARITHLMFRPGHPDELIAAAFGRGVWRYNF